MARSFNGTSDKILAASPIQLPNGASAVFTFCAWVYPLATPAAAMVAVMTGSSSGGYLCAMDIRSTASFRAEYNVVSAPAVTINGGTPTVGVWAHLLTTLSASVATFYVNGVSVGTGTLGGSGWGRPGDITNRIHIGEDSLDGFSFLTGRVADVAVWNGSALSQTEISALAMGVLRPHQIRPQKLSGFWPLDGYLHPALDYSVFKGTGAVTGTALAPGPPLFSPMQILPPKSLLRGIVAASNKNFPPFSLKAA